MSILKWADVVFVGAMQIQQESFHEVIRRAHALGKTVVAGGRISDDGSRC